MHELAYPPTFCELWENRSDDCQQDENHGLQFHAPLLIQNHYSDCLRAAQLMNGTFAGLRVVCHTKT
jgi:hypothetical protein